MSNSLPSCNDLLGREAVLRSFLGNASAKQSLIALTNDGRLCHALLLTGESGCGKRTFARIAAAAMVCESVDKPCGVCVHCRKALGGIHPDVITLDCADTANDGHRLEMLHARVLDTIAVAPNEAARKVYVIANLESISFGSSNALLKTLEEPPAHAAFILTARSREALLETVLSRVIPIAIEPLPDALLTPALCARCPDAAPDDLRDAAAMCFGSLGDAVACVSEPARMAVVRRAMAALQAFAGGAEYSLLVQLTDTDKDRDVLRRLLTMLLRASRAALEASVRGRGQGLAAQVAPKVPCGVWLEAIGRFADAIDALDHNVSRSLLPVWLCSELIRARNGVSARE